MLVIQEEVAIKIIDLEQFNTNWDEIRVGLTRLFMSPFLQRLLAERD